MKQWLLRLYLAWMVGSMLVVLTIPSAQSQNSSAPADLVEQLTEATVYIESQVSLSNSDWLALPEEAREAVNQRRPGGPTSGSGFLISRDGYIVTNAHVVGDVQQKFALKDGTVLNWTFVASSFKVVVRSGVQGERTYLPRIIKVDKQLDLALLKISPREEPRWLPINPAGNVKPGMAAFMAGFPGGKIVDFAPFASGSETASFSDAPNPRVAVNSGSVTSIRKYKESVRYQLDIGANHGNSGGPIVNDKGEVIGILYAGIDGMNSINYAIPARYLKSILPGSLTEAWPATREEVLSRQTADNEGQKFEEFVGSGSFKLAK